MTETGIKTQTDYLAGRFQYKVNELQFFPHVEGYVNVIDDKYNYVFNYTDHLGNIRVSYGVDPSTSTLKVLEENHYYPFGLKHEGYNMDYKMYQKIQSGAIAIRVAAPLQPNYKYKYNGKELQTELGLNMYDMDMRDYDPAIARWVVQDPVVHYDYSPYNAFDNNPVIFADPSGADAYEDKEGYHFTGADAQNFFSQLQGQLGETSSDSSPENDITVNSKGKITNIVINDKPHRIFDTDGNQLYVNDYAYDSKWLDLASVDEQLYVIIDNPFLVKLILKAGFVNSGFNMSQRYLETALNSHGSADFGFNQLRDELDMHNTEYDGYEDGNGAFFRVQGQKSIYNFADFSQFVWGSWMRVNNFSSLEMKAGAHINNFITTLISTDRTGGFIDSEADQRAIQNGFNYTNNLLSK
ncbi:RHS repeat domain-containing protein [Flavobacterium sp. HNIBRBA15423]|uniref:RHS repeat domain-containing protein n=1 Tax=Flavobacterium sp. HNIBRBA15423 TaxID=3458683 RepID=UPI004044A80B